MPYESRTGAVLFARDLERVARFYAAMLDLVERGRDDDHVLLESPGFQLVVHRVLDSHATPADVGVPRARRASAAIKPVFFVPSMARLRGVADAHGGMLQPADLEWRFNGVKVCDAVDPEGNVIQFRENAQP